MSTRVYYLSVNLYDLAYISSVYDHLIVSDIGIFDYVNLMRIIAVEFKL